MKVIKHISQDKREDVLGSRTMDSFVGRAGGGKNIEK
jgi:hypothetical protein